MIVDVPKINVNFNLIATRHGTKSITSNDSIDMVTYNTESVASFVTGILQSTQHMSTDFGRYHIEFSCPECSTVETYEREVEVKIWTNPEGEKIVEPSNYKEIALLPFVGEIGASKNILDDSDRYATFAALIVVGTAILFFIAIV